MFTLSSNLSDCTRRLDNLVSVHFRSVTSRALNATAQDVLQVIGAEMQHDFDRPTPFTLGAFMVKPSNIDTLSATVQRKEKAVGRHYLEIQERGGPRFRTGVEGLLAAQVGYQGTITAATPSKGARLDQYGNWSTGQRNEVLSALGAQRDSTANSTAASRKRKKNPSKYFVPTQGLKPGVYERTSKGVLRKILNFTTKMPTYEKRFDFGPAAEAAAMKQFPSHFARRMAEALAKS